jgi:hypothetical protein
MLRAFGLPVLVLLIVREGGGDSLDRGPLNAEPAAFHALEIGKIAEGLQKL